jgi:sortase A
MSSFPGEARGGTTAPEPVRAGAQDADDPHDAGGPRGRRRGRARASPGRRRITPLTVVGIVLLVSGLSCLGWLAYQYVGSNVVAERAVDAGRQELRTRWQQPEGAGSTAPSTRAPAPLPGDAVALLRIPAFGPDFEVPVLEGTDLDLLSRGVGHYAGTAQAGEVGNFAVAGHRVTHGEPFRRLLELGRGDQVVVETRTAVHTYVLDEPPRSLTVADTAGWVLDPVPGRPAAEPSRALITLTTGQDLLRSPDRAVGFGHLESTRNK